MPPQRTEQVPRTKFEEIALDEGLIVLQYMLDILRTVDDDTRWQRRHRDLESLEADLALALAKPVQELVPGL